LIGGRCNRNSQPTVPEPSSGGSRSGGSKGRGRKPQRRKWAVLTVPLKALGRGVAALWRLVVRMLAAFGALIGRQAASARGLDPEHRRDGGALLLIAFGLVAAIGIWLDAAGPVGRAITSAAQTIAGNGAVFVPVLMVAGGAFILSHDPRPESRGRVLIGWLAITLSVLGLFDLWADLPRTMHGRQHAGGLIGAAVATPLPSGLSAVIAVPLLLLLGGFGILVVTATPISALVSYVKGLFGRPRR
jgi:S-DNA-T family DNA segregation ATPase FtsK/SpoIIIE